MKNNGNMKYLNEINSIMYVLLNSANHCASIRKYEMDLTFWNYNPAILHMRFYNFTSIF